MKTVRLSVRCYLDNRLIILQVIIIGRCIINEALALREAKEERAHAILVISKISLLVFFSLSLSLSSFLCFPLLSPLWNSYLSFFPFRVLPRTLVSFLARPLSGILFEVCPSLLLAEIIEVFSTSKQWAPFSKSTFLRATRGSIVSSVRMSIAAFRSDAADKVNYIGTQTL